MLTLDIWDRPVCWCDWFSYTSAELLYRYLSIDRSFNEFLVQLVHPFQYHYTNSQLSVTSLSTGGWTSWSDTSGRQLMPISMGEKWTRSEWSTAQETASAAVVRPSVVSACVHLVLISQQILVTRLTRWPTEPTIRVNESDKRPREREFKRRRGHRDPVTVNKTVSPPCLD